jgi:hypothetical protein
MGADLLIRSELLNFGPVFARRSQAAGQRWLPPTARGGRRRSASGLNTTGAHEWLKAQRIEVKDRGRVPAELLVKFKAATGR